MDINCTSNCEYQKDGKCALIELPAASRLRMGGGSGYYDACLYFRKKQT